MAAKNKPLMLYDIHIRLSDIEPAVWRRFSVPRDITLANLHHVIQCVMGWQDDHLHAFVIGRKRYEPVYTESIRFAPAPVDESIVRLNGVAKPKARFRYQYDFGDNWLHELVIERETAAPANEWQAICLAGENACPPEDCGGPGGYADLLEILGDPQHEQHEDIVEWLGEDFDPGRFDLAGINAHLSTIKL